MHLPIGVSDFRKLIETRDTKGNPYLFVDKTLFIKDILDDLSEVKLFTRPRRFGKTLNMSMLHHFLAKKVDGKTTQGLFDELNIAQHPEYINKHQGQYPVIFISFKDIKSHDFQGAYLDLSELIRGVYLDFENIIFSENSPLSDYDKSDYKLILNRQAPESLIKSSLKNLTFYLYQLYQKKPWVIIDEYDTPIQTAYSGGYYQEMVDFMRGFLGAGLKDNSYLERAILTGILRISKESIFSGLNNIKTYSLLNSDFGQYFGFTEPEINALLKKSQLESILNNIRHWYNGYQAGNTIIYNPWSIINCVKEQGRLSAYWVNISDNLIIKELLLKSSIYFKSQFEILLQDNTIEVFIDEQITFNQLEANDTALWSLLFMSGYLKAAVTEERSPGYLCRIQIPNFEVKGLYRTIIAKWLSGLDNPTVFSRFIDNLLSGNIHDFAMHLKNVMLQSFSVYDIKGNEPEKFFHGFLLGLTASTDHKKYQILSNRESGYGRFDIAIIPKDQNYLGIIIEVKSTSENNKNKLEEIATKAVEQISLKQYDSIFIQQKIKNYLKIGVAFCGKNLAVDYEKIYAPA